MPKIEIRDIPEQATVQRTYSISKDAAHRLRAYGLALIETEKRKVSEVLRNGEIGYFQNSIWRMTENEPTIVVNLLDMLMIRTRAFSSLDNLQDKESVVGIKRTDKSAEYLVTKIPDKEKARIWATKNEGAGQELAKMLTLSNGLSETTELDWELDRLPEDTIVFEVNKYGNITKLSRGFIIS